jgi:ABC-type lipoprotein export system ATPase subunit
MDWTMGYVSEEFILINAKIASKPKHMGSQGRHRASWIRPALALIVQLKHLYKNSNLLENVSMPTVTRSAREVHSITYHFD